MERNKLSNEWAVPVRYVRTVFEERGDVTVCIPTFYTSEIVYT